MNRLSYCFCLLLLLFSGGACGQVLEVSPTASSRFLDPELLGVVDNPELSEASGLAASMLNQGALWTHNDSGNEPKVYLLDTDGKTIGTYVVGGARNRDWEDIAVGPGPVAGQSYVYVGEIGDNKAQYPIKKIYRFPEPKYTGNPVDTIQEVDEITFMYADGPRDAETLMLDPLTRDLYIVSKRDQYSHVYRLAYPHTTQIDTLEIVAQMPREVLDVLGQPTGGDISADGREILIKSYTEVYYWKRDTTVTVAELLQLPPQTLLYSPEPQGEAITFARDGKGYYTLSEERGGIAPHLYFYPRE